MNLKEKLEKYFEPYDIENAIKGLYRLTAANQAIHDNVYVPAVYRLAELVGMVSTTLRYRTCSRATPMDMMLAAIWAAVDKDIETTAPKLEALGFHTMHKFLREDDDGVHVAVILTRTTGSGSSFEKIELRYGEEPVFTYSPLLYNENITRLPMALVDMQQVVDMFYAITHKSTQELIFGKS